MADNVTLNPGAGGATLRADEVAGVQIPASKIVIGADGADGGFVSAENPLPVTVENLPGTQPVSGTVAVSNFPSAQPVTDNAGSLTVDDGGGSLTVDGTVGVAGTVPVSGTFWQATQPVSAASLPLPSGAATETSLGTDGTSPPSIAGTGIRGWLRGIYEKVAAALDISDRAGRLLGHVTVDNLPGTQSVSGSVSVSNLPVTQPVSAASLPLPAGAATEATTGSRLSESDFDTKTGGLTETAPATDTASSGLNGRLQRIAQRLSSLIALLPTSLGGGGGLKVEQVAATPAGTNLIGATVARLGSSTMYDGIIAVTPKFATVDASASGDTTLVAIVAGKKIRVLRYAMSANGSVNARLRSATVNVTKLNYLTQFAQGAGAFSPVGIGETAAGEALSINLSGAVPVSVDVTYLEI